MARTALFYALYTKEDGLGEGRWSGEGFAGAAGGGGGSGVE